MTEARCDCGTYARLHPRDHFERCGKRAEYELQLRQAKALEQSNAAEQERTKAARTAAAAATKQAELIEKDLRDQQSQRRRQEREANKRQAREDSASEILRGWRARLAQLMRLLDRDPERAWLDLRRLREDIGAQDLSARDFNPAEREAFSRFEADVDTAGERLDQHYGPAVAAVRGWIKLASQRAKLEAAARADDDDGAALPSYEDAVQRRETARRDRERIESLGFPPAEPGWAASTTPLTGGLEATSHAAQEAWAILDKLPRQPSPGPEPTPPEPPMLPEPPTHPAPRRPTDHEAASLTATCGVLCALTVFHAVWLFRSERLIGPLAAAELVLLVGIALGAAALQLVIRRRDGLAIRDHDTHLRALELYQRALLLHEEHRHEYDRALAIYRHEYEVHQQAMTRHREIEATRLACQGVIAQATHRFRTAHRDASQREDEASLLILALTPLREFDNDSARGGFLASINERRRDLCDDIDRLVR